jgi:uncharacterized protein YndB with AHSA1/START domain
MADIIHRIGIKAPASRVYKAVSTVPGVAGWWTKETTGSSKVGGEIRFLFHADDGSVMGDMRAKVKTLKKNRRVAWRVIDGPAEWIGSEITFDISAGRGMTILLFGHRKWKKTAEFMAHCSMKWATFLLSLRQLVETGKGKPAPNDLKIDDWN